MNWEPSKYIPERVVAKTKTRDRPLSRLPLDKRLLYLAYRNELYSCKDILAYEELDLMDMLDIDLYQVHTLYESASQMILKGQLYSASSLLQKNVHDKIHWDGFESSSRVRCGVLSIDQWLGGGFLPSCISEFVAPAGSGKTQFCHQIAVVSGIASSWQCDDRCTVSYCYYLKSKHHHQDEKKEELYDLPGVIYMDTESTFSATRIQELATARGYCVKLVQAILSRISTIPISSINHLVQCLESLEMLAVQSSCCVLILDSLASVISTSVDRYREEKRFLIQIAQILKASATKLGLRVIVTNQVTSTWKNESFENLVDDTISLKNLKKETSVSGGSDQVKGPVVQAAFGPLWAYCVNTRLSLEYREGKRYCNIVKSPVCACATFAYTIENAGIVGKNQMPLLSNYVSTFSELGSTRMIDDWHEREKTMIS